MINRDISKAITAEDLIRRYNLGNINNQIKKVATNSKNELDKTNNIINKFVETVTESLKELQDQVDGNITTWFFNGVPTIENEPSINWINDNEKNNHLGDLYYDQNTGYAYRFALENGIYSWIKITDSDVTEALAIANSAKDTADSKRRIFVSEPTTPYEVGDIWLKDDKEIYRCRAKRNEGTYMSVDWIPGTDYTNDDYAKNVEAVLNQFKTTVETDYVTNVALETTTDSIISSVESTTTKIDLIGNTIGDLQDNLSVDFEKISNKIDGLATVTEITEVKNSVQQIQTNSYTKTQIQNIVNGTGFDGVTVSAVISNEAKFDKDGMHYSKSDKDAETTINYRGVDVARNNKEILYAGIDEDPNSLTYGSSIVRTNNLIVETYMNTPGKGRIEEYTDSKENTGIGFFIQ